MGSNLTGSPYETGGSTKEEETLVNHACSRDTLQTSSAPTYVTEKEKPAEEHEGYQVRSPRSQRNMWIAIGIMCLNMCSMSLFFDSFGQWTFVRFAEKAIGENYSQVTQEASSNPCFHTNHTSPYQKELNEAQAAASTFNMISNLVTVLPATVANLVMGSYADQIGRRLIFILPIGGFFSRMLIVCIVAYWHLEMHYIFIGNALCGISGDFTALSMRLFLYSADSTDEGKSRSFGMVFVQDVAFATFSMTRLGTGYFINSAGYVWPMITGTSIICLALLLSVIFLQETLDFSRVERVGFFERVKGVFSFYFEKSKDPRNKRVDYFILASIFLLLGVTGGGTMAIQTLYLLNEPFCWSSTKIGYVSTLSGIIGLPLVLGFVKIMQVFFSDEVVCAVDILICVLGRFFFAFGNSDWWIYAGSLAATMDNPVAPMIIAMLSRKVPQEKRGSVFASVAIVDIATVLCGSLVMNALYAQTVAHWSGLTYFIAGVLTIVGLFLMGLYTVLVSRRPKVKEEVQDVKPPQEANEFLTLNIREDPLVRKRSMKAFGNKTFI